MLLVYVLGVPVLVAMCGCGQAVRFVRETPDGGVVTMPMNTNRWPTYYRNQAEQLMHQKCPDGYRIDREAAVGIGLEKPTSNPPYESYFGYTGGSEAEQEYHITFHGVSPGNRPLPKATSSQPGKRGSAPPPASLPAGEDTEELPPPRPLSPSQQTREKDL